MLTNIALVLSNQRARKIFGGWVGGVMMGDETEYLLLHALRLCIYMFNHRICLHATVFPSKCSFRIIIYI